MNEKKGKIIIIITTAVRFFCVGGGERGGRREGSERLNKIFSYSFRKAKNCVHRK